MAYPVVKPDTVTFPPLDSYSTAIVLTPPLSVCELIDPLRSANDKAFSRWKCHMTLFFPFVQPSELAIAADIVKRELLAANIDPFEIGLQRVGTFNNRNYNTIYLGPEPASAGAQSLQRLWTVLKCALRYRGRNFSPHVTVGQAAGRNKLRKDALESLALDLVTSNTLNWTVSTVTILTKDVEDGGKMKVFEEIPISAHFLSPESLVMLPR